MIEVTCAIIEKTLNETSCFLVCQRSENMRLPLKWEFPGGKLEPGETKEDCLTREISEELGIKIEVNDPLTPVTHQYNFGKITLFPYQCSIKSGQIKLTEHINYAWHPKSLLTELDFAPADLPIVQELKNR